MLCSSIHAAAAAAAAVMSDFKIKNSTDWKPEKKYLFAISILSYIQSNMK